VDIDIEDFRSHFEMLSDATLLATKREDLVAAAQAVYDEEIASRGLDRTADARLAGEEAGEHAGEHATEEEPEAPQAGAAEEPGAPEPLVAVGEFTVLEEARLARGLLQDAGIPCGLVNDKLSLGVLHLMVPESQVEGALEVLGGEISEEDLAAQAEAAGLEEAD
jgi:hypothetical protein